MSSNEASKQLAAMANAAGIRGVVDEDAQPVVKIEKDLFITAMRFGEIAPRLDIYSLNGELVLFNHKREQKEMTSRKFRTWIRRHVITAEAFDKDGNAIRRTLNLDEASVILDTEEFLYGVREIVGVNQVRCPVIRPGGELELLPWGYDEQTRIYTVPGGIEYQTDLDWEAAKGRLGRQFGTFPITDDRSMAVQVAAMLALYIRHLPGGMGLRPGFLWYANKPGSGKSVLAKACLYPVLGRAAAAKMKKNDDLDKELEAFSRAAVPYIFLDNIYGGIQSASIDQLITSEESTGRAMGGHGIFTAKNSALVLATGNQIELNDDALRRFLLVDLFEKGNPDDRDIPVPLDDGLMKSEAWRVSMLESLFALVKHWHETGMPQGSVGLASFEGFSRLLGGIVEAAGYAPPFAKAELPDAKSPGRSEFEELLRLVMDDMGAETTKDYRLEDLCRIARAGQLYQRDVGTLEDGKKLTVKLDGVPKEHRLTAQDMGYMSDSHTSAFGKRMSKVIGTEPVVNGRQIQFGKRKQNHRAVYTVTVLA